MPKNEPRRHHHIPQCYLKGFATGSGKHARVQVASFEGQRWFETHPKNIALERDFLRIDVKGHAPDAIEKEMASLESEIADSLRNIEQTLSFRGEDRNTLLNFIALLAVRSPWMREHWRKTQDGLSRRIMDMALGSKEMWESQMRQMKKAGRSVNEDVTYEQMKDFHERGEYEFTVAREWHIHMEFHVFRTVLEELGKRQWSMYVTNDKLGPFVTCDRPVSLTWMYPEKVPPLFRSSPGHGMPDTQVYVPMSHRLALLGEFNGEEGTYSALPSLVAMGNVRMIEHAAGQLYTIKRNFMYFGPPLALYHDAHFQERFAAEKERRKATSPKPSSQASDESD